MNSLEATLEAWRPSRDPELAALVAILSDRILAPRKSLGKGIRAPEKWLEAAKHPPADRVGRHLEEQRLPSGAGDASLCPRSEPDRPRTRHRHP